MEPTPYDRLVSDAAYNVGRANTQLGVARRLPRVAIPDGWSCTVLCFDTRSVEITYYSPAEESWRTTAQNIVSLRQGYGKDLRFKRSLDKSEYNGTVRNQYRGNYDYKEDYWREPLQITVVVETALPPSCSVTVTPVKKRLTVTSYKVEVSCA